MKVFVSKFMIPGTKKHQRALQLASMMANKGKPYDIKKIGAKTAARMAKAKAAK